MLESEWRQVAHTTLLTFVPNLDLALEARFGEQFMIDLGVKILTLRGYDGNAFAQLSRRERIEFLERLKEGTPGIAN